MKHLKPLNKKAQRIDDMAAWRDEAPSQEEDVVALQQSRGPAVHTPMGCSLMFSPGWEVDAGGGTAGLCQPVERDLFDCYASCFWPVQVPDHVNYSPDWAATCAIAAKDWRKIDVLAP